MESKTEVKEKPGRGTRGRKEEGKGMKRTKMEEKGSPQKGEDPGEGSGGPRTQTR